MPVDLWTSPAFVEEARAWVAENLPDGARLTGEWQQPHARPWSSAIRFETTGGRVWFKVNGPGSAYEAALTGVLARVVPDLGPEPLAVDGERAWTLLRDAGEVMRRVWDPDELWERWPAVLQRYAVAQQELAGHADAVLGAGVDDLAPERLAARFDALVADLTSRPVDEGGLSGADEQRLRALADEYDGWCRELVGTGIAPSVNHDDLHSSNVCVPGGRLEAARVIDWGDSVWSHPFGVLLATLNSIAFHAGCEPDDARVRRVGDAYLEVWSGHGSLADLRHAAGLARRTGCVTKALSYVRAFEGEPLGAQAAEHWPVRAWLLEVLDPAVAG